ncbi:TlpA family protein disulfide reductase [Alkalicoccobacillus murimartini]|uniref:Thiol-disulfide isomerase/thioredoxin n=1 Tax=Alkalicoccobacillus murimartini TaxID=171685 RepID=A0ABT9YEY4_9BACI|nr:TlpA disulfide reductase family protein [Alkalicoccobacillus murimartini]MDQ0205767.1 thiol-disulfide isomerase/thioredoxin [Alkalicoccobacillus murimartini]
MKRNVSLIILTVGIGLAAVLLIINLMNGNETQIGIDEGMQAESIELDLFGGEDSVNVFSGDQEVTILNIWATWCEPCVRELPDLMDLEEDYRDEGLSVHTVNAQKYERVQAHTEEFIEEQNVTLPVFLDKEGAFFQLYQIRGMPTTFVIDSDQTIVERIEGEVTYEMLEEKITPLLNN